MERRSGGLSKVMLLVFLFCIFSTNALPQGAPTKVCQSMLPSHSGIAKQPTTSSPFKVIAVNRNEGVQVVIRSPLGIPFGGFMLQARTPGGEIVGAFESPNRDGHTIECLHQGDTMTHNSPDGKEAVEVTWAPVDNYNGIVIFNATVAQDYSTFWVGVESIPIDISRRSVTDDYSPTVFSTRPRVTTPSYFTPELARENAADFDPFYTGCDETKQCFGTPAGCINSKNCKAAVAITVNGDRHAFEMKATDNAAWVGVGLSDDAQMGDDSVIECVKQGNAVTAFMSYTSPRPNLGVSRLPNSRLGITLERGSAEDGSLYCKVVRDTRTLVNGRAYDLSTDKYNLLIASGSTVDRNRVGFHDLAYLASGESKSLADVSKVAAASKLLLRLHGAFMLAAWLGVASVGILLARYYRNTWVGSTLCGKDQWFAWHRMLMILTWSLTMVAFVLIFVELKAWSAARNPHAILGLITTIICFIQPIGAFFRPHPGTSRRPIFNWLHWLGGNAAHILAIVTIFFAVKLAKAELPEWFDWILVTYVAFHVLIHLILSVLGCVAEKSANRRVTSFPMKDLAGSGRTSAYADPNADAPLSGTRKALLAIYIVVVELLVISLIVITVLAPIEEFWESMKDSVNGQP